MTMTKHFIRTALLSFLLLISLVLAVVACGGGTGTETATGTPTESTTDTATEPSSDTEPATESHTETATETDTERDLAAESRAYYNGEDITVTPTQTAEIPVGRLTILGHDISEFRIISTEDERGSASTLRDYIAKATSFTPECIREHSGEQYEYEIVVGICESRTPDALRTRRAALGDEGYAIYTEGNRLYITGATMRGTWYGVISFLEDYIGCRFFTNDCEVVLPADVIEIGETDTSFVPKMFYRSEYADFCNNAYYSSRHKLNSYIAGNLDGYGGGVSYAAGAFVHTFRQLAEMKDYKVGDQPCLTDPAVYETVLKNVREWLRSNRNATVISVSPNDSYTNQAGCQCANCKALDDQYGSPMGSLLTFVNRIARDIREEFPNVYVETLAYHYTQTPPTGGLTAEDNVLIRLCPSACCLVHGIEGCERGEQFVKDIAVWSRICKHLSIWHYSVNFANYLLPMPNLFSIYDDVQLYVRSNVCSIFDEGAYNSKTGEFEELRAYLFSKLMWNPDMSREEYERHMNEFLQYYYGDGWEYIRRYIDATYTRIGEVSHFNHAADLKTVFNVRRTDVEAIEFLDAMCGLFDKAMAVAATPEQQARLRKGSIQILYMTQSLTGCRDEEKNEHLFRLVKEAGINMISEGKPMPDSVNYRQFPSSW